MTVTERLVEFAAQIEEPKKKKRNAIAGTLGAFTAEAATRTGIGVGILSGITTRKVQPAVSDSDKAIIAGLHKAGEKAGYTVRETDWLPRIAPAMANPKLRQVDYSPKLKNYFKPGVLAHEIGHAKDPILNTKIGQSLYQIGKAIPAVSSAVAGFTGDEKTGKKAAVVGAVGAAPLLGAEIGASVSGIRALRKAGIRGLRSLTPAVGLPTYGAIAAAPAIIHATKKKFKGYKQERAG